MKDCNASKAAAEKKQKEAEDLGNKKPDPAA